MKIKTGLATAICGAAVAGFAALTVAPAGAAGTTPTRPAVQAASVAPHQATISQSCWDGDCGGWGWDDDWDDDWGW
jgi:hypothetical protein